MAAGVASPGLLLAAAPGVEAVPSAVALGDALTTAPTLLLGRSS